MHFPQLAWRDQVIRIQFEDGCEPAYITVYNGEITSWTDNAPAELKHYGGNFNVYLERKLSSRGMAFYNEGINE